MTKSTGGRNSTPPACTDLALKFDTAELVEALELSGSTVDGGTFSAVDCVRLVPAGRGTP